MVLKRLIKEFRFSIVSILLLALQTQVVFAYQSSDPPSEAIDHSFDLRPVYSYVNTTNRDGSNDINHTLNLRARYGLSYHISDKLTFRSRAALRLSDKQGNFRFRLDGHTGGNVTYPAETATLFIPRKSTVMSIFNSVNSIKNLHYI